MAVRKGDHSSKLVLKDVAKGSRNVTFLARPRKRIILDYGSLARYNLHKIRGCSSVVRALPCQGRGRELESLHPHQNENPTEWGFYFGIAWETLTLDRSENYSRVLPRLQAPGVLESLHPHWLIMQHLLLFQGPSL